MNELVILSFDTQADADQARKTLQQVARDSAIVLPEIDAAVSQAVRQSGSSASGLRGWVLLPWRASSRVLGGALTALTWSSLVVGAAAGYLAERLLGLDEKDDLRQQVAQAIQPDKASVILLANGKLPAGLVEEIAQTPDQVYRTRVSASVAARIQAAFQAD